MTAPDQVLTPPPSVVKRLKSPASLALADLAALHEDLQTTLLCCERLMTELGPDRPEVDQLALEAFWTTAVLSYARCFATGPRGTGLTEDDITATKLEGDVLGWHRVLLQVTLEDAAAADEAFAVLMGEDVEQRRSFIQRNAKDVRFLDI